MEGVACLPEDMRKAIMKKHSKLFNTLPPTEQQDYWDRAQKIHSPKNEGQCGAWDGAQMNQALAW